VTPLARTFAAESKSVRVLLEVSFQRHGYLEIVDVVDGDEAADGKAAVVLQGPHPHEPRDGIQQLAVSAADRDAASDQLLDGSRAPPVTVVREREPAVTV